MGIKSKKLCENLYRISENILDIEEELREKIKNGLERLDVELKYICYLIIGKKCRAEIIKTTYELDKINKEKIRKEGLTEFYHRIRDEDALGALGIIYLYELGKKHRRIALQYLDKETERIFKTKRIEDIKKMIENYLKNGEPLKALGIITLCNLDNLAPYSSKEIILREIINQCINIQKYSIALRIALKLGHEELIKYVGVKFFQYLMEKEEYEEAASIAEKCGLPFEMEGEARRKSLERLSNMDKDPIMLLIRILGEHQKNKENKKKIEEEAKKVFEILISSREFWKRKLAVEFAAIVGIEEERRLREARRIYKTLMENGDPFSAEMAADFARVVGLGEMNIRMAASQAYEGYILIGEKKYAEKVRKMYLRESINKDS